ncbi:MAG: Putative phage protein [uncultured Sulfurovum sp.]|uniref:Phage protein n=1 Tax=uncultured Sulfurovum sp. TaxID=269237 RepID=A0A6S6TMK1_9BACT|nr:MAG: Putative phage protein [uncultured Sulfurovum sp.]
MIVKNNLIEIAEDNIFKNDTLGREESIVDLSKLLLSTTEPFVFSINGSWGTGKTTFVKLWEQYLKKEHEAHSLYFSAWEDDFSNEPLIAILGSLNGYIEENFKDNHDVIDKFNQAKEFGGKVLKRGLPAFVKGMTGGVLDLDKGVESAMGAISEETAKGLIENYSKEKEITEQFKQSINELLELLDSEQPFIIFIDELDRCRPLYAIELLERIKHLFGIEKLIFVLSIDKEQLSESIKSQYGNIDTDNYLRRFIDLEYKLSNLSFNSFCDKLYQKFKLQQLLDNKRIYENGSFLRTLKKIVFAFPLSLRQIEQVFSKLHILFKTLDIEENINIDLLVILEVIKSYQPSLYHYILEDKRKELYFSISEKLEDSDKVLEIVGNIISNSFGSLEEYEKSEYWKSSMELVIKKIEFLDKFNMESNS